MKNILIITGNEISHNYLINKLKSHFCSYNFDVLKFFSGTNNYEYYMNVYGNKLKNEQKEKLINFIYNRNKSFALNEDFNLLKNTVSKDNIFSTYDSLNKAISEKIDLNIQYDLVLVYSAPLITDERLFLKDNVYNIHMGLSKYYKGATGNIVPLSRKEFNKVGLTCHKLTKKVDDGDILFEIDKINYNQINSIDQLNYYLLKNCVNKLITYIEENDYSCKPLKSGTLELRKNMTTEILINSEYYIKEYIGEK